MQFKVVLVSALVGTVAAQSTTGIPALVSQIPSCALSCIIKAAESSGCGVTDYGCQCGKAAAIQAAVQPCIVPACSAADQASKFIVPCLLCTSGGSITNPYLPAQPP